MKRDTGASISFVDSEVLGTDYIPEPFVQMTTVQGVANYPTTLVRRLKVNGHRFAQRMAISSGFQFDALLGTDMPDLKQMLKQPGRQQPSRRCKRRPNKVAEETLTEDSQDEQRPETPYQM